MDSEAVDIFTGLALSYFVLSLIMLLYLTSKCFFSSVFEIKKKNQSQRGRLQMFTKQYVKNDVSL